MANIARFGGEFFGAITSGINGALDGLECALSGTPWPVTMAVTLILAWQLAGPRVAVFTAAALAYPAILGFREKNLETVVLRATAAILCLFFGIPLGIWRGRRPRVYAALRPAVVRLTALGLQGVPPSILEAAQACGATRWLLLMKVGLPLVMPSIMAEINQPILMCRSMVVIASLIGAEGLGEDVLNALQYAAVGQGLLAGLAIWLCAMVIDRVVQGKHGRR